MKRIGQNIILLSSPMTNASVDAIAIVRTMKNIATALQLAEQLLRSLENDARPWPTPGLPEPRLGRLL